MKKLALSLLSLLAFAIPVSAATIAPTAFTSDALKAAIASAGAGDVVDLSGFSGTLTVDEVLFPAVSMTVKGPADQSVVLKTSIASGSKGHAIFATSAAGVTLTLENLAFKDNVTGGWGSAATDNDDRHPGVVRTTGPLVLKNCLFDNNKIIKDEAANTRYGSANVFSAGGLSATDCSFTGTFDNRDSYWDYFGEVVLVAGGTVGVTNCFFTGNGWTGQAAGNFLCVDTTSVSFSGCRFEENLAQGGGAVMTIMNGPVVFKDCIFRKCQSYYGKNNMNVPGYGTLHPNQTTIYGNAGALWLAAGTQNAVVENCEFTDCSSFGSARGGATPRSWSPIRPSTTATRRMSAVRSSPTATGRRSTSSTPRSRHAAARARTAAPRSTRTGRRTSSRWSTRCSPTTTQRTRRRSPTGTSMSAAAATTAG